jgi:hypothetical protein
MPHILITSDTVQESGEQVLLRERVTASDLSSGHFAEQLIERVGWALLDAEEADEALYSVRPRDRFEQPRGRRFPRAA